MWAPSSSLILCLYLYQVMVWVNLTYNLEVSRVWRWLNLEKGMYGWINVLSYLHHSITIVVMYSLSTWMSLQIKYNTIIIIIIIILKWHWGRRTKRGMVMTPEWDHILAPAGGTFAWSLWNRITNRLKLWPEDIHLLKTAVLWWGFGIKVCRSWSWSQLIKDVTQ